MYATVTLSPYVTGLARVRKTFVPETDTLVTALELPFAVTRNAEVGVDTAARERLKVISIFDGVASFTTDPEYTGI